MIHTYPNIQRVILDAPSGIYGFLENNPPILLIRQTTMKFPRRGTGLMFEKASPNLLWKWCRSLYPAQLNWGKC